MPLQGGEQRVYAKVNDRWEVCIAPTDGQFQQVSSETGWRIK